MTRDEYLAYCKICLNRKIDIHKGLVCTLTNEIADFESTCPEFKEDAVKKEEIAAMPNYEEIENEEQLDGGAKWFLWIFALSVVNTLISFFGGKISFIFGLGFTKLFDAIFFEIYGKLNWISLLISINISVIFLIIWNFSKKLSKGAFIIGMIIYGIDALLLGLLQDWASFAVHLYALFMIFKGYQSIDLLKKQKGIN